MWYTKIGGGYYALSVDKIALQKFIDSELEDYFATNLFTAVFKQDSNLTNLMALHLWYRDINASLGVYTIEDNELQHLDPKNAKKDVVSYVTRQIFERLLKLCIEKTEENMHL